jgi:NADH-quinone oxidoreductase subunit L
MTTPLLILAIPAVAIGFWGSPFGNYGFQRLLEGSHFHEPVLNLPLTAVSALLAIAGIVGAWLVYGTREYVTEPLVRFGALYRIVNRRYYIDELYMWLIDKLVIAVGYALTFFDRQLLDQLVNGIALAFAQGGRALRTMQTGRVQNYGLVLFGGMAVIALALLLVPLVRR